MKLTKICSTLTLAALGIAVATTAPLTANAQDGGSPTVQSPNASSAVMDRIDRLERDIRTLNQQLARGAVQTPAAPTASGGASGGASGAPAAATPPVEFTAGEGMASRLMVRLGVLESEVRAATGQSESLSFRINQLTQRFDKLLVDLDYRLARLEGSNPGSFDTMPTVSAPPATLGVSKEGAMPPVGQSGADLGSVSKDGTYQPPAGSGGTLGTISKNQLDAQLNGMKDGDPAPTDAAPATPGIAPDAVASIQAPARPGTPQTEAAPPATPQAAATSVLPEGSAKDQYRFAFDLTRQARYGEAEIAFKAFIDTHGEDALANNARYWLAETYYVRKRYMDAAQAFFEAYQKAPEGTKAADSLLKLGMSMAGMDKQAEACATFGKLRKEFTPLKANIEQTLNRETKRLDCK